MTVSTIHAHAHPHPSSSLTQTGHCTIAMEMRRVVLLVAVVILVLGDLCVGVELDLQTCVTAVGVSHTETIKDNQMSASSYHAATFGPQYGRLHTNEGEGAWCPAFAVTEDTYEFLQITLGGIYVISYCATQGREKNSGQEYAEMYRVEYRRSFSSPWFRYVDYQNIEVLEGNDNQYDLQVNQLSPPMIAREIRFIPLSVYSRHICMRVEMYGCPWAAYLIAYDMPQGNDMSLALSFRDFPYDGLERSGLLRYGLGLLTDGLHGQTDFLQRYAQQPSLGYQHGWVGWARSSTPAPSVVFRFDVVQNLSSIHFLSYRNPTIGVEIFQSLTLSYSHEGIHFSNVAMYYASVTADVRDNSVYIAVNIPSVVARYVRCDFQYSSDWIMISEVYFKSTIICGSNFTDQVRIIQTTTTAQSTTDEDEVWTITADDIFSPFLTEESPVEPEPFPPRRPIDDADATYSSTEGATRGNGASPAIHASPAIVVAMSILATLVVTLAAVILFVVRYYRRQKNRTRPGKWPHRFDHGRLSHASSGRSSHLYNVLLPGSESQYAEPSVAYCTRKLPTVPYDSTENSGSVAIYAEPDLTRSTPHSGAASSSSYASVTPRPYAQTDLSRLSSIQPLYLTPTSPNSKDPVEYQRNHLKFVEFLGEGQFGQVHLCIAPYIRPPKENSGDSKEGGEGSPLIDCKEKVAVKMLRNKATPQQRDDFFNEMRVISSLHHANIVSLLAVCTKNGPPCMILEYMEHGDLHTFLRQRASCKNLQDSLISYEKLIYMARQIASGMRYLESLSFIHRDLATRNCLCGANYLVKIADFGMSRELFKDDYYKIEGKAVLPIRWMSWESVLQGRFTIHSDVWAFAVTVWEVLTFAKDQPYCELTDSQVMKNIDSFETDTGEQVYLRQPDVCPNEVYELLSECWSHEPKNRPSFSRLFEFFDKRCEDC